MLMERKEHIFKKTVACPQPTKKKRKDIALIPYFMLQNSSLINKNPIKKHFKHQLPLSQP
jgi:hypothetical protein